jgi:hypothetical protein
MFFKSDSDRRIDAFKLDGDLRDAYVELLSAQCAVDRIKLRYAPEEIATKGSSFMVSRSISAANMICEYFSRVQQSLAPQAGQPPKSREGVNEKKSR